MVAPQIISVRPSKHHAGSVAICSFVKPMAGRLSNHPGANLCRLRNRNRGVWRAAQWAGGMLAYEPRTRPVLVPARRRASLSSLGVVGWRCADAYREAHRQDEAASDLVPVVLKSLLESCRAFAPWCRRRTATAIVTAYSIELTTASYGSVVGGAGNPV